jgi:hypothetical protein
MAIGLLSPMQGVIINMEKVSLAGFLNEFNLSEVLL